MDTNKNEIEKAIEEMSASITELNKNSNGYSKPPNKRDNNFDDPLTVKDMIDNLKKKIDTNSSSKLFQSSQNLNSNDVLSFITSRSTDSLEYQPKNERTNKASRSRLCQAYVINSESDISSYKNALSNQVSLVELKSDPNNVSGILSIKKYSEPEEMDEDTDDMYPLTDSFINKIVSFKNCSTSQLLNNYDINIPEDMNLEEAIKTLVRENMSMRLYSKDVVEELKEVLKTNEMLENENNDLEIKMKGESLNKKSFVIENEEGMTKNIINKINDIKLNMMQIILNYITNLNSINDDILSDQGIEKYYNIFEGMINDVTKLTDNISTTQLQSSIEENMKKNIEFEFFKYKNNYTFTINECNNKINELKHNVLSLKKEKEVLIHENRELKNARLSIDSDIGGSKNIETQSITSISSDCQEVKSMYEIGSDNTVNKNSKFSKLTSSAKKIIKNTSNKKLFKDKKTRSRGFSVSLPVKPIEDNQETTTTTTTKTNKRRNSIMDKSSRCIADEVIPHVFIPHSYIKPTKCEICQELCWRKEVRCKTCGYRCHERCQGLAEKITSCIVNKVQKTSKISEMESQKKLFGTTISTYGINEIDFIPSIVKSCINEVEKRGLKVVGIYRRSGNVIKTRNLVKAYDSGENPDITENGEFPDIAVITSTLKQYFRDLPDALIPERFFEDIKEIIDIDDEVEQIGKMKGLVQKLPKTNYETLKFLCIHLNNVDANSDVNLMTSKNLGVVFGPTLIGESGDKIGNNMISTVCRVRAIDLLIRCAKEIFDYVPDKDNISMEVLEDRESTIREKQRSIDIEEEDIFDDEIEINARKMDNRRRNTIDVSSIKQL